MIGPRVNKVLDKLHQATVAVLVCSTVYFGVEAVRATMAIQNHKYKQKVCLEEIHGSSRFVQLPLLACAISRCCCSRAAAATTTQKLAAEVSSTPDQQST